MRKYFYIVAVSLLFLSGCMGGTASVVNDMHEILENVADLEADFKAQHEPIRQLEQQEQEIYNEIILLSMDQFEKIKELSATALEVLEERKNYINAEKESIEKSKEQFETISPLIEELANKDENGLTEKAQLLYDTMKERYDHYDELYDLYLKGLEYDSELYKMFQDEQMSFEQMQEQVEKINSMYEQVAIKNNEFNQATEKYNELKLDFYNGAGLNVADKK